jgi:thioredoxin
VADTAVQELTDETYESEAKQASGWSVVDFYATWCPHCKAFRPIYEEVAAEYAGPLRFFAADVEQCEEAAQECNIRSIPTVIIFHDGEPVDTHVGGMTRSDLSAWLEEKVTE